MYLVFLGFLSYVHSDFPVFLPTILNDMGFNAIDSQGLTAPPFFLSFLITIFSTWVADKTQQRGCIIMVLTTIGGIGYILLASVKSVGVRYFGVFLAASGIFPSEYLRALSPSFANPDAFSAIANILPWVTSTSLQLRPDSHRTLTNPDNQGSDTRRGTGIVLLNLIGQCGVSCWV